MNFKTFAAATTMALAAFAISGPVHAEDDELAIPGEFSANVSILTDYRFRGVTQTDNEPAIQGGFDWAHDSGFYLGTRASNVNFGNAHIEMDFYGGYANSIDNFSYDVGLIYYWYPGASASQDFDFFEAALGLGYDFESFSTSLSFNYSPENFGDSGDALFIEGGVGVPLPYDFELGASLGYQLIDDEATFGVPDYLTWTVGLSRSLWGFDFGLSYVDTDESSCGDACGATVIFSVSRSF